MSKLLDAMLEKIMEDSKCEISFSFNKGNIETAVSGTEGAIMAGLNSLTKTIAGAGKLNMTQKELFDEISEKNEMVEQIMKMANCDGDCDNCKVHVGEENECKH